MIAMKFGWLLLEGILLGIFLNTGNAAALAFAGTLVILPLCILPVNLLAGKHLNLRIESAMLLKKGEEGTIQIVLENPSVWPVLLLRGILVAENQLNRQTVKVPFVTCVMPGKQQRIDMQTGSAYCGRLRLHIDRVRLYDSFGLFGVRCAADSAGHLTVQPDTFEQDVNIVPTPGSADDSEAFAPDKPGFDLSEPYQIREYVPGDSIRQIHWKLSGKFDRLIVREPSLPITRSVLVFWERTGDSGDPQKIDAQAEVVVSLCRNLLEQSVQFTVGWNDTDRNQCVLREIHDMDELIGIIPRILRSTGVKDGISGAALLRTAMTDMPAHVVYIAEEPQPEILELGQYGNVTMLLCGETAMEGAMRFDSVNYAQQLRKIEL